MDRRQSHGRLSMEPRQRQRSTAGTPQDCAASRRYDPRALDKNLLFVSAARPLKVVPPLFNRYSGGQAYGGHIDGAVRSDYGSPQRARTDLSAREFSDDIGGFF
jgi:predicted 2-oxoglutarate/Fe(II)-dependent dioxygenase YbiX